MSGFFISKKLKIYDILPYIEMTSNDESIWQNTTDDDFTLVEKQTKDVELKYERDCNSLSRFYINY